MAAGLVFLVWMPSVTQPTVRPTIAFFSDVDGTLMDVQGRFAATPETLARIASRVELILTSSRTVVELARIQRSLRLVAPAVAENGAVVALPPRWRGGRDRSRFRSAGRWFEILPLGEPAAVLRRRVRQVALEERVRVVEQRDLLPDAGRSLRRMYSLCIRNRGGAATDRFLTALRSVGLEATRSGHWITVTAGADKSSGVREVLETATRRGSPYCLSVGIGNAENDGPLLAACDHRFVIRNPRAGHDPALLKLSRIHALSATGLAGWRDALGRILQRQEDQPC